MIELDAVSLSYRDRVAVRGVSLALRAGELTVVVGPNGAGKSSLLKLMTGEVAPTDGSVRLDGRDLRTIPPAGLALRRAVLPQSSSLAFPFTVGEVVRFGLDAGAGRGGTGAIAEALARVDLTDFAGRLYGELSGGEQQRVHLARVLCQIGKPVGAHGPRFLFLDEPVSSLDIRHQLGVLRIAKAFARDGGGVLAVLHDLNLASAFADRLIAVDEGRIVADGPPAAVLSDSLMETVFGVSIAVGIVPPPGIPFILPQTAAAEMRE